MVFLKDVKQVYSKFEDSGNSFYPATLINEINPNDFNFQVRDIACSSEIYTCIVTSTSSFFKVDFTSSQTTFSQIDSKDSFGELCSPTDVAFIPKTNYFLMRMPEWNSIQRWSLDDMTKFSKIDSADYSDQFLSTMNDNIYFFGYQSVTQRVIQYDLTSMARVSKSKFNQATTVNTVVDLVPINTSTYGVNPVALMESNRVYFFNWLGSLTQIGNLVSFYVSYTYKRTVAVDYLPYLFIMTSDNYRYGQIYCYRFYINNGQESFSMQNMRTVQTSNYAFGYMDYSFTRGHIYVLDSYYSNYNTNYFKLLKPASTTLPTERNLACNEIYPLTYALYPVACTCKYGSIDADGYYCKLGVDIYDDTKTSIKKSSKMNDASSYSTETGFIVGGESSKANPLDSKDETSKESTGISSTTLMIIFGSVFAVLFLGIGFVFFKRNPLKKVGLDGVQDMNSNTMAMTHSSLGTKSSKIMTLRSQNPRTSGQNAPNA